MFLVMLFEKCCKLYVGCLMFLVYVWGPHNMDVQLQSIYLLCHTLVQEVQYPNP